MSNKKSNTGQLWPIWPNLDPPSREHDIGPPNGAPRGTPCPRNLEWYWKPNSNPKVHLRRSHFATTKHRKRGKCGQFGPFWTPLPVRSAKTHRWRTRGDPPSPHLRLTTKTQFTHQISPLEGPLCKRKTPKEGQKIPIRENLIPPSRDHGTEHPRGCPVGTPPPRGIEQHWKPSTIPKFGP